MQQTLERLQTLGPEMVLLAFAAINLMVGLSKRHFFRRTSAYLTGLALVLATLAVFYQPGRGFEFTLATITFPLFVKLAVAVVGFLLLLIMATVPDQLRLSRDTAEGKIPFDSGNVMRGEFHAFFLLSLTGAMLCAGARDLVWLFLALELTSLPTYVLVATSREEPIAQEAGVKYFFLGAMAAAVFLYGFALIYGATGSTEFAVIHQYAAEHGASPLLLAGVVLALVGMSFKIAAVPMHFYVADVYEGATTPVTAFLAFVPKTAGFVSIILVLELVRDIAGPGQGLPAPVPEVLWIMAVATMTVGNVMGLLQENVKRILAYSSIAHTGYMLVGLIAIAGPSLNPRPEVGPLGNGVAAVLFYLIAYGLATISSFGVLACIRTHGEEVQTLDDLSGLRKGAPGLAVNMLVSSLSLLGLPPFVGFIGKVYLFGSALGHGYIWLVVIAVLNSGIGAVYYLRIVGACFFGADFGGTISLRTKGRRIAAAIAAVLAVALGIAGNWLVEASHRASATSSPSAPTLTHAQAEKPTSLQASR